jgi:aspartyl protease family protein
LERDMTSGAKEAIREALIWIGTAFAGLAVIYFYHDISALLRVSPGGQQAFAQRQEAQATGFAAHVNGFDREIRLNADGRGHFVVEAAINERPVTMIADTGATLVMLTYEDAERLGLSPRRLDFSRRASTANGTAKVAPLTLAKLRVADIVLRDVPAAVAEPGALGVNLLGMSFLGRLKRFEMRGDELLLAQ